MIAAMAQQAKTISRTEAGRQQQIRFGVWIELVAIGWMIVEASDALITGFLTRSISLQGFGIDSIVELISGGILLWRLVVEQRGGSEGGVGRAGRRPPGVSALGFFPLPLYF